MKRLFGVLLIICLILNLGAAALAADTPADAIRIREWEPREEETEEEAEETEEDAGEETPDENAWLLYTGGLDPKESVGDIIISNGLSWKAEDSCVAERVEIEPGAVIESDHPVVILFSESDTVQNGEVRGNIVFVQDYDEVVAVVHTNDTRGYLNVEPYVKGLADQLKDSGAYSLVLTVSAGNVFSGGYAAAHVYNGEYIPYVMGGVYDFFTWGANDAGLPGGYHQAYFLSILAENAGAVPLGANLTDWIHMDAPLYARDYEPAVGSSEFVALYDDALSLTEEGTIDYSGLALKSFALERGENVLTDGALARTDRGTTIGLFGLNSWSGADTGEIFYSDRSSVDAAQTMADALRAEGADVVVGIGNVGWLGEDSEETGDGDTNAAQLARSTFGVDAYVVGGMNARIGDGRGWLPGGGSAGMVNQSVGSGESIGVMYLILKDGKLVAACGENILQREDGSFLGIVPDEETMARVRRCYGRLSEDGYNTAYTSTEEFLNGERLSTGNEGGGVRANETNLGDLVADGLLWAAKQRWEGDSISSALCPGAMIGTSLRPGYITLADALAVFSRSSQLVYREYTCAELVDLFNEMCAGLGRESDGMLQVAGLTCGYEEETGEVGTLSIGDTLYYDHGTYLVDEDETVRCAVLIGADEEAEEGTVIVSDQTELARLWCEFLSGGSYTVYPNEPHPAGRVAPIDAESAE